MARARNAAFERAARAFVGGQKALAVGLSKQAQALDVEMKVAHKAAAAAIFGARNSASAVVVDASDAGGPRDLPVTFLDLHGLHPREAVDLVGALLDQRAGGGGSWVALLTGSRSHSKRLGKGGGSVHAAVAEALAEAGVTELHEPAVASDIGGVIVARIT